MIDITNRIQEPCDSGQYACGFYVDFKKGGMEISKYQIMGGWKNLSINEWVRHNGEVDLKIGGGVGGGGGNPFQSNLVPQKILDKTFWPNTPKILNKCTPELAQDTFSFTFPCV